MKIQHTQQDREYDPKVKKTKYVQVLTRLSECKDYSSFFLLPFIISNFQMSYSELLIATHDCQPFQGGARGQASQAHPHSQGPSPS